MKLHCPTFLKEWKRQLIGGAAVGGIYTLIAVLTGLSDTVSRTAFPPAGTVLGVLVGCIYLVVNFLLLDLSSQRIAKGAASRRFYLQSYLGRYLWAAVVLVIGFMYLDPFAVFVTMLAPRVTYLFYAVTGKEL